MIVGQDPLELNSETEEFAETETTSGSEMAPKDWSMMLNFDFDESELTANEKARLDSAWTFVISKSKRKVVIQGHTDNIGSANYNDRLSDRRCQATLGYLKRKGLPENRIAKDSFGFRKPASSNA